MKTLFGMRRRFARISLRRKLPIAFAGVALLAMVALGAILLPVVSDHYSRTERSYLKAAAEQAAGGLSGVDWQAVAAEQASGAGFIRGHDVGCPDQRRAGGPQHPGARAGLCRLRQPLGRLRSAQRDRRRRARR